ncbi:putative F-box domain-containing protein [Medicago truncatula]|uniref:F-box protein interaction domain protein n=1 Tax=Medicago truncatula TaxID=3880 RepID=G7IVQ0_MEDTR|nr:F-box/kelch-repeat protein At3g23880 [Medicago truncatula]XP_039687292.1 F-box/kelch-repeat protein At3g23880 [Medicago truncatula]AES68633.1 F-box protein interaction domain protein [Medicago truncatula]RHN65493.1 putative F-box domain-containing protein [Medicago truncatula]
MAQGNEGEDNRNAVDSSDSLVVETTNTQRQRLAAGTLTCPPEPELPALPFDLLPEILCRLPVKLLVQLRCVCKFFNSLISDPNFAKKHLRMSTKRHHLMLTNSCDYDYYYDRDIVMCDSPIPSIFSTSTVVTQTQLYIPNTLTNGHHCIDLMMSSCDGIFCGKLNNGSYFLWNPSIRKFKLLPPLRNHKWSLLSFGYDHFIDNYKVVAHSFKKVISVNTLGTDYWRRIKDIPYSNPISGHGLFVSGTVNWFAYDVIISLDLEKESYQKLRLPDFDNENNSWDVGVVRDCLCVFASSDEYWDVWIMKEYGNQESWTKLYTIPNLQDQDLEADRALYISEDDQLLVQCHQDWAECDDMKLVVYDSKAGTLNFPVFRNNYKHTHAEVYIESLISP